MYGNENEIKKFFPSKILARREVVIEDSVVIEEFPDYVITKEGRVYNATNGLERRPSMGIAMMVVNWIKS